MILRELSSAAVQQRLEGNGLCLRTGPFVTSIRTSVDLLAQALMNLYAEFPVVDDSSFSDFHIEVAPRRGLRRWVRPQAVFRVDGSFSHDPFRLPLTFAFFEWGFNGCIAQSVHHYLVLHGAVVERHGRTVVLLGPSGSGKSTLCAALTVAGWRLLSDELTLIAPGSTTVLPLARPISLKGESIAVVRALDPDASFGPSAMTLRKGLITHVRPPIESVRRMQEPARLSRFIFVTYKPSTTPAWQPLSPGTAFTRIAQQAFNYGTRGQDAFGHVAQLVDECPAGTLTYGNIHDAVSLIERDDFQPTI